MSPLYYSDLARCGLGSYLNPGCFLAIHQAAGRESVFSQLCPPAYEQGHTLGKNQWEERTMSRQIFQSAIVAGVVALALCSFTQEALAQCENGVICTGTIDRLYTQSTSTAVNDRGTVFIRMDPPFTGLTCDLAGNPAQYVVLLPNQKLFKEIYASLLAGITNKDVTMRIRIDPDSEVCKVAYVTIER